MLAPRSPALLFRLTCPDALVDTAHAVRRSNGTPRLCPTSSCYAHAIDARRGTFILVAFESQSFLTSDFMGARWAHVLMYQMLGRGIRSNVEPTAASKLTLITKNEWSGL